MREKISSCVVEVDYGLAKCNANVVLKLAIVTLHINDHIHMSLFTMSYCASRPFMNKRVTSIPTLPSKHRLA